MIDIGLNSFLMLVFEAYNYLIVVLSFEFLIGRDPRCCFELLLLLLHLTCIFSSYLVTHMYMEYYARGIDRKGLRCYI